MARYSDELIDEIRNNNSEANENEQEHIIDVENGKEENQFIENEEILNMDAEDIDKLFVSEKVS